MVNEAANEARRVVNEVFIEISIGLHRGCVCRWVHCRRLGASESCSGLKRALNVLRHLSLPQRRACRAREALPLAAGARTGDVLSGCTPLTLGLGLLTQYSAQTGDEVLAQLALGWVGH